MKTLYGRMQSHNFMKHERETPQFYAKALLQTIMLPDEFHLQTLNAFLPSVMCQAPGECE